MTPQQHELEETTWNVHVVDAEVKLYLLALVRASGDADVAQALSGLDAPAVASARGWLARVGVLRPDGSVDSELLQDVSHHRRALVAA
jgi:hypothetical protein